MQWCAEDDASRLCWFEKEWFGCDAGPAHGKSWLDHEKG